jgi:hypothetical protein
MFQQFSDYIIREETQKRKEGKANGGYDENISLGSTRTLAQV